MPGNNISEKDLVDLHGKVVILTGGNTGIGYATIQMLARRGAKVYMAARDEGRAKEAIKKLEAEDLNDGSIHWLQLDLADPREAQRAAKEFLEKEQRLDILINNAAIVIGPYKLTKDGLLDIMIINHFSPFVFTDALLPLMKATATASGADVRIVNLSSNVHSQVKPTTFTTKEAFNVHGDSFGSVVEAYGISKLANLLHVKALQTRLNAEAIPITCISVHPGGIQTTGSEGFLGSLPFFGPFVRRYLMPLVWGSWRTGAMNVAFAAAGTEVAKNRGKYQGAYLVPTAKIGVPSRFARDERLQKELYETTERFIKEMGL